ncbi:hypothetical protein JW887_05435 [Candidatus Dojkabacteria bacterium]|nr:hypothetical protein [Candidatus Dojkabacteria bacterium]
MTVQIDNPLLSEVMRCIHRMRPKLHITSPFYDRIEKNGNFVSIWFLTSGCQWNIRSGCTMCNYGQGSVCNEEEIVNAVHKGLSAINVKVKRLLVSPSGSMLDPQEVPPNARRRIYSLIRDFPSLEFAFETRPETITNEVVKEVIESIPGKRLSIQMGLESSNAWIQRFCINKGSHPNQFTNAAQILTAYGVKVYANISIGTAFLNPQEAINDAVRSVQWAISNGVDVCMLFPLHVKSYTLLFWLYQNGFYHPPSLWSLVEVLRLLDPKLLSGTKIAWYRNYYENMIPKLEINEDSDVIASPTTCPKCQERVLELLDEYCYRGDLRVIDDLDTMQCECKDVWKQKIGEVSMYSLPERVLRIYKELASLFLPDDWWSHYGSVLEEELFNTYSAE